MKNLRLEYFDKLIQKCNAAKELSPVKEFEINPTEIDTLQDVKNAIYIIEQIDGCPKNTFKTMKKYKNESDRKCPRINTPSRILYVGSSTTNLKRRLNEHLGNGNKGTYALHLKYWLYEKYKIIIMDFNEIDKEILGLIEDSYHHVLKPAFGKPGPNGK
ncbi:GIY-YIG nuclease family protein [Micavibrio aeruginosavorus]|uniref:GIY-YIG nuclease family protein n=1 Tax=Micavibrio aeruginosavorus TaxID=349221 RepID=UPI003F4A878F